MVTKRIEFWQTLFVALALLLLVAVGGARAEDGAWTLDGAVDYALAHNPDLAEDAASIRVAEEARREVFGNFLPQLTGEAGYQYIGTVPEMNFAIDAELPIPGLPPFSVERTVELGQHDNWLAQLKLNQLLFASGRVHYGYQAAGHGVDATRARHDAMRIGVAQKTAETFLGVMIAQRVHTAQSASLAQAEAHLAHVTHREDAGAASQFELLRAQVEVDNLTPAVTQAAETVSLAKAGLRRILGLPADAPIEAVGTLETDVTAHDAAAARERAAGRPEFAAYRAGAKAYEARAASRLGEMLPAVMLTGTYGYQKPYYFDTEGDMNWTVGVGVQIPIFDGLKAWRGRGGNLAEAEKMRLSEQRFHADVANQLISAELALSEAAERIGTTAANVKRAARMVDMAEESYAAGALTSLDVIDAQLAATGAQLAHVKALYDYRVAKVRLAAATGDLEAIRR